MIIFPLIFFVDDLQRRLTQEGTNDDHDFGVRDRISKGVEDSHDQHGNERRRGLQRLSGDGRRTRVLVGSTSPLREPRR